MTRLVDVVARSVLALVLLGAGCAGPTGPGTQQATFPAGQRVARSGELALELMEARYDVREVAVRIGVTNGGGDPVVLERQGVLLAYGGLEYPVAKDDGGLAEQTTVGSGQTVTMELRFVTEQPMVEAGVLVVAGVQGEGERWVAPLRIAVPPSAAFVDAAREQDEGEDEGF